MYIKFIIFSIFQLCSSFHLTMKNKMPNTWDNLRYSMKETARKWFINRAVQKGIPWSEIAKKYEHATEELMECKEKTEDKNMKYPDYYLKPFHGYNEGNMLWRAAYEAESATLSIAAGYWDKVDPITSQEWMRQNITNNINYYIKRTYGDSKNFPERILDIGCSTGISTTYMKSLLKGKSEMYGLDLSPYFIAVADYNTKKENQGIVYVHGNAEKMNFQNKTFDLIVSNFLFHELPDDAANAIIKETYDKLNSFGVIAIVDIDPAYLDSLLNKNVFRRWAFEVTEPHIYNYYQRNTINMLKNAGFTNIDKIRNDPLNSIWVGTKPPSKDEDVKYKEEMNNKKIEETNKNITPMNKYLCLV